jgi:hypothetical protein
LAVLAAVALVAGCDWESDDDFNTSQGAGADINFSGVYRGMSGSVVSGSGIDSLLITQIGNSVMVQDSNGGTYEGSIGSPGIQSAPGATGYPAGATMLQAQMAFSGGDVSFVGVVRAVAATDVYGWSSSQGQGSSSTNYYTATVSDDGTDPEFTFQNTSGEASGEASGSSSFVTFQITEANTQYILEGNWVFSGGVAQVNGIARGVGGTFSTP